MNAIGLKQMVLYLGISKQKALEGNGGLAFMSFDEIDGNVVYFFRT